MAAPERLADAGLELGRKLVPREVIPRVVPSPQSPAPRPTAAVIPESERKRLEQLRSDIEYTKSVLKSSPIARSAKAVSSLATQAGAFLNWWERLVIAYFVMLGDPDLAASGDEWWAKSPKLSKENLALFKKHWNSDLARETRWHDLRVGNAAGRMMYVAKTLGSHAFAYPQDSGFQLGRSMRFGSQHLLDRIRYLYDSDEAGRFVNENGNLLVDLPVSILVDFGNPIFAGIARAPRAAHDLYAWRQLGKLDVKADIPAMRKFILGNFEGGVDDDHLWKSLHGAWTMGGRSAVKPLLEVAGFTAPGVLGTLNLSWLRRPGKAYSAAQAKLLLKHRDALMRADELTARAMETSKPLMDFLQSASPDEILQFTKLAYEKKSVAQVADEIMRSARTPASPAAFNAWKEFGRVAEGEFLERSRFWSEEGGIALRNDRIQKAIGKLQAVQRQGLEPETLAKEQAKLKLYIERNQDPAGPPWMEHYWKSVLNEEAVTGQPIEKWATRWHRELNPKEVRLTPKEYAERLETVDDAKLRSAWKDILGRLQDRPASEVREASWKQFRDNIDKELALVKSSKAEEYGGKLNQQRLTAGLEDFKELAARAATPQDKQYVNRILGTITTAVKSLKLLFPPFGWQAFNLVENTAKNLAEFGFDHTFRMPPMGSKIGTTLDFTSRTPKSIFTDPDKGFSLMSAPGLKWYNRYLVQPVNDRISRFSTNVPGAWAYHDALQGIEAAMPGIPAEEAHRLATRQAMDRVGATQFNVDHISPSLEFLERFGALAPAAGIPVHSVFASFWTDTIRFWMGKAIEHPVAANALYKLEDAVKEHSISGDGKLYVPGTGIKIDPGPGLTYRNLIDIMERTKPLEIGETAAETAVKILRSADSGAAAFVRESAYAPSLQRMVKGDNIGLNSDVSNLPTNAQKQDALHRISGEFYGLNSAVKAVTGQDILNYFAFRDKLTPEAKIAVDERIRRGMAVEQRAAWLNGENPDNEELMHRFFQSEKTKGILSVFGLQGRDDPGGVKTAIENTRDTYYKQPGYDQRAQMRDHLIIETPNGPKHLLDVVAARPEHIPDAHPQKEFLNRFRDAKNDPEKARELYNEASNDQKRGILENFVDWWKNVRFKNPFVSEAGGAEFGHDDIPIAKPDLERLQRQLPDPRLKQGLLHAPEVMEGNNLRFFREDLLKQPDPYFRELMTRENARYNTAMRAFISATSAATSKAQWDEIFTKGIPLGIGKDGTLDMMPIKIFMDKSVQQGSQTYLSRALNATMNIGTLIADPKNPDAPPKKATFYYGGAKDVADFLASNGKRYPQRLEIAESHRIRQENLALRPYRDQMLETLNPSNGKSAAELEARFKNTMGAADGPPKDLYRRLLDQGDYALVSRFALHSDAEPRLLEPFKSIVYSYGRYDASGGIERELNPRAMDFMVTSGHLHELQLLGLSDPRIARYVKEHWPDVADTASVERESMSGFLQRNGVKVGEGDVRVSGGIVPAWMVRQEPPPQPKGAVPAAPSGIVIPGGQRPLVSQEHAAHAAAQLPPISLPNVRANTAWAWDPVPHGGFRSTTQYVQHSIDSSRNYNARIALEEQVLQKDLNRPDFTIPRQNFFGAAAHYLPALDPAVAVHGAASIMTVANRLNLVDDDSLMAIHTGMNEQALVGAGINAAGNVLSIANNLMGGMSSGERKEKMKLEQPGLAKAVDYAGQAGSLLSFGAGINAAAGGPEEASIGMGVAGGALSGASMGAMLGPWGMAAGAVIGGAMGGLMSAFGGGGRRSDAMQADMEMRRQLMAKQMEESEMRMSRMRASSMRETQRDLNMAFASGRIDMNKHLPAVTEWMRRPTYASSQGLVRSVESSIFRTLTPRY